LKQSRIKWANIGGSAGKLDDIKMLAEKLITDVMKFER